MAQQGHIEQSLLSASIRSLAHFAEMKPRCAEQNYRERVARVVATIVADPTREHSLEGLAREAHFSPWHFHRVYSSIVGETVAATVRRVRLALATRLLAQGDQNITQVAMAVGYESPQAFTRAFGQFAGQSPRAFQLEMQQPLHDEGTGCDGFRAGRLPSVQIIDRPAQRVYALRHRGPFSTIPHVHRRLQSHPAARHVSAWLGASFGDPEAVDGFRYYAAAVSGEPWPAEADIEILDIPAGRYASHRLVGPYARINATLSAIFARWLPSSGYEPDDRPTLEHYLNAPRDAAQVQPCTDLLIPIRSVDTP